MLEVGSDIFQAMLSQDIFLPVCVSAWLLAMSKSTDSKLYQAKVKPPEVEYILKIKGKRAKTEQ